MQAKLTYKKFVPISIARAADERFSLMTDTSRTEGFTGTSASPAASARSSARSSRSALNALSADSAASAANALLAARTATTMGRFADCNHVLGVRKH